MPKRSTTIKILVSAAAAVAATLVGAPITDADAAAPASEQSG